MCDKLLIYNKDQEAIYLLFQRKVSKLDKLKVRFMLKYWQIDNWLSIIQRMV